MLLFLGRIMNQTVQSCRKYGSVTLYQTSYKPVCNLFELWSVYSFNSAVCTQMTPEKVRMGVQYLRANTITAVWLVEAVKEWEDNPEQIQKTTQNSRVYGYKETDVGFWYPVVPRAWKAERNKNELKENMKPRWGEIPPLGANEHISRLLKRRKVKGKECRWVHHA